MHKVICEEPRHGGGRSKQNRSANLPDELLPKFEGIKCAHTNHKWFGEHLGPLKRWLWDDSPEGPPFDVVFKLPLGEAHAREAYDKTVYCVRKRQLSRKEFRRYGLKNARSGAANDFVSSIDDDFLRRVRGANGNPVRRSLRFGIYARIEAGAEAQENGGAEVRGTFVRSLWTATRRTVRGRQEANNAGGGESFRPLISETNDLNPKNINHGELL